MKKLLFFLACMASLHGADSVLLSLTSERIQKKEEEVRRVVFVKKAATITLAGTASIIATVGLYFLFGGNNAEQGEGKREHSQQEKPSVEQSTPVEQVAFEPALPEEKHTGFMASIASRLRALGSGFAGASKQALFAIPQSIVGLALQPVTQFFANKLFFTVNLRWSMQHYLQMINKTHIQHDDAGNRLMSEYAELKFYKHDLLYPAYALNPDNSVVCDEKKNFLVPCYQEGMHEVYWHTFIATMNKFIDTLAHSLAVVQYKHASSANAAMNDEIAKHVYTITNAYVAEVNTYHNVTTYKGLFACTVHYLASIEHLMMTLIKLED